MLYSNILYFNLLKIIKIIEYFVKYFNSYFCGILNKLLQYITFRNNYYRP